MATSASSFDPAAFANTAFTDILRLAPTSSDALNALIQLADGTSVANPMAAAAATLVNIAGQLLQAKVVALITGGGLDAAIASAVAQIGHMGDATTSVATLSYQFFTGKTPSAAGLDFLVHSATNAADLNDPYYAKFSEENRYINFAVNLGKLGDGAAGFQAAYGGLSMLDAVKTAYLSIFGTVADDAKAHALLDPRLDYFAAYGQDGPTGIGTKAAMVGWLLAEAAKADTGPYATANDHFLADLADGVAQFNVNMLSVYGASSEPASVSLVGMAPMHDGALT